MQDRQKLLEIALIANLFNRTPYEVLQWTSVEFDFNRCAMYLMVKHMDRKERDRIRLTGLAHGLSTVGKLLEFDDED